MPTRIIFMGTPDFAVPTLTTLLDTSEQQGWEIVAVVTQPDRPKGRGKKLTPPPVKVTAQNAGLYVLQPPSLKAEDAVAELTGLKPDLIVVAAFGQILRKNVLNLPTHGCLNVHASLLPRWRGASPVTAAIAAGDAETGVTIMQMAAGLDTGPIITQRSMAIKADHTGGSLTHHLAEIGASLLVDTLPGWLSGQIEAQPQAEDRVTMTRLLKKRDGEIDWNKPAVEIERLVRAFSPWPGTFTSGPRGQIKIMTAELADDPAIPEGQSDQPGTIFRHARGVYITTGDGLLRLVEVQPAGKKVMPGEAMINGQPDLIGMQLGKLVF